jgi:hypothetical protein
VDILQFAGLTFIIVGLMKRVLPWKNVLAIAGIAAIFITPLLLKVPVDEEIGGYLVSLFTGGLHYNFFPVLPWIAFPLIGIGYGENLKNSKNRIRFFINSMIAGVLIIVSGFSVMSVYVPSMYQKRYSGVFRQGKLPVLVSSIFTGFLFVWIPVCYFITEKAKKSRLFDLLYYWSRNVTWFYAVQWVIIGWACAFLPYLSWWQVILMIMVILFLTDRILFSFGKKMNTTQ